MRLPVKVHADCFNVQDPRIEALRTGKLSSEAFALTIRPDDVFVILGDTIYVLSEEEYYINKCVYLPENRQEGVFKAVLALTDTSFMSEVDRKRVSYIKADLPNCPSCRYKRYHKEIYAIGLKYKIAPNADNPEIKEVKDYPAPKDTKATVSTLLRSFYQVPKYERKACIDCVEKHISQAYILAAEVVMGYDAHFILFCGHLGEALEEMPGDQTILNETLRFCLAKSCADRKPFLPFGAILHSLLLARANNEPGGDSATEAPTTLELDFTEEMRQELSAIPGKTKLEMAKQLETVTNSIVDYKKRADYEARIAFEGALATVAETAAQVAPTFANMLRNRRLMFRASPDLAEESGYGVEDIITFLRT